MFLFWNNTFTYVFCLFINFITLVFALKTFNNWFGKYLNAITIFVRGTQWTPFFNYIYFIFYPYLSLIEKEWLYTLPNTLIFESTFFFLLLPLKATLFQVYHYYYDWIINSVKQCFFFHHHNIIILFFEDQSIQLFAFPFLLYIQLVHTIFLIFFVQVTFFARWRDRYILNMYENTSIYEFMQHCLYYNK